MKLVPIAVLSLLVAGCATPNHPTTAESTDPIIVSAPDDYSYLNQTNQANRSHIHDYWGGRTQLTEMDTNRSGREQWVTTGNSATQWNLEDFVLPPGSVIPQGTAAVTVTVTITPAAGDKYRDVSLTYRTAAGADNVTGPLPADKPIRIATLAADADLPHQMLSAWRFRVSAAGDGYLRLTGNIRFQVVAERGLPIPLYPGHPDQWNGTRQIELFSDAGELEDVYVPPGVVPGSPEVCSSLPPSGNCVWLHLPSAGAIVPVDAWYVGVEVEAAGTPQPSFDLYYHGADAWDLTKAEPAQHTGSKTTYEIPLKGNGDGPYSRLSLWEFALYGTTRALETGSFKITAIAYHDAPLGPATAPDLGTASGSPGWVT